MSKKFVREDKKRKRVPAKWRRPRGLHNKVKLEKRGHTILVKVGYKRPSKIRGLINGRIPVIVNTLNDLKKISKDCNIIVGRTVGAKKMIFLLEEIQKQGLTVNNIKNIKEYIAKIHQTLKEKQELRKNSLKKKKATKTEKQNKVESMEENKPELDKKKELDKLLIKPEK
ncbi:hypothetical protein HYV79_00530 [Candidatus Woesearchaeota archaeon]|nr:hypothetical protein [Candidatus Woesearchaeota archaeon]